MNPGGGPTTTTSLSQNTLTGKYSSHRTARKLISVTDRDHYRKAQPIKVQRFGYAPVQIYIIQLWHLEFREHCRRGGRKTVRNSVSRGQH